MTCIQNGFCYIGRAKKDIRFNYYVLIATLTGISLLMTSFRLMAYEVQAELIQTINTSGFPAPDTAGIVYLPSQDAFLVTDSEIEELDIFQGVNVFKVGRDGGLLETFSTLSFSDEPTGITINPDNNHCFISDDTGKVIYEIDPGADDLCLTGADETVTSFRTGIQDQEDVTYGEKSLFIVDGVNNRVYSIRPGPNGVFDDVLTGDDLYNIFDTESLGVIDPEGIVFDQRNNTLFIVGHKISSIIETTPYGVLLGTIDITSINSLNPSGLALVPTLLSSDDQLITSMYMVARGEDNVSNPDENDGMIYELKITVDITQGNKAPVVSVGENQSIRLPAEAMLNGSVSDDGETGNPLISTWSKYSGPGEVIITNPNSLNTSASFSAPGTYKLALTGYDGELYSFKLVTISVSQDSVSTSGGGGSTDFALLLVASAFLFRRRRKGDFFNPIAELQGK